MGCDDPDVSRSDGDVRPGIPADEPECGVRELDIEVLAVVAATAALDPDSSVASGQDAGRTAKAEAARR